MDVFPQCPSADLFPSLSVRHQSRPRTPVQDAPPSGASFHDQKPPLRSHNAWPSAPTSSGHVGGLPADLGDLRGWRHRDSLVATPPSSAFSSASARVSCSRVSEVRRQRGETPRVRPLSLAARADVTPIRAFVPASVQLESQVGRACWMAPRYRSSPSGPAPRGTASVVRAR